MKYNRKQHGYIYLYYILNLYIHFILNVNKKGENNITCYVNNHTHYFKIIICDLTLHPPPPPTLRLCFCFIFFFANKLTYSKC